MREQHSSAMGILSKRAMGSRKLGKTVTYPNKRTLDADEEHHLTVPRRRNI